jgi:hypothetical protein
MSGPKPGSHRYGKPRPKELAGTALSKEEDQGLLRARGGPGVRARGAGGKGARGAHPPPTPQGAPTANDLAGIPVCAEGDEDLTVHRRNVGPRR